DIVIAVAAQIGGINQRTAIRTEFGYKSRRPLPGTDARHFCRRRTLIRVLRREVDRVGVARYIRTARAVHRDTLRRTDRTDTGSERPPYVIGGAPAKIAGIAEYRVDDQRPGMVVAAEPEAYLVPGHGERPFDAGLPVAIQLVQHRLLEAGWTVGRTQR